MNERKKQANKQRMHMFCVCFICVAPTSERHSKHTTFVNVLAASKCSFAITVGVCFSCVALMCRNCGVYTLVKLVCTIFIYAHVEVLSKA